MRVDFLQEYNLDQYEACPTRHAMIQDEQAKVYNLLNRIIALSIPGLDAVKGWRARDGLLGLLNDLRFTL